ncbi:MAG: D-alanyl-D-alanine carboxypeptidase family protein [Streptosporangiales bacterium]
MTLRPWRGARRSPEPHASRHRRTRFTLAFAWVIPALLLFGVLIAVPPAGDNSRSGEASGNGMHLVGKKSRLVKLKKKADKASSSLNSATKKYKSARNRYQLAQAQLKRTKAKAERKKKTYEKGRKRVASFAVAAYSSPLPNSTSVLLTSKHPRQAVQQATSLNVVTRAEAHTIKRAQRQKEKANALVNQAEKLSSSLSKQKSKLHSQMKSLKKESKQSTQRLMKLLQRMNDQRASRGSRVVLAMTCGQKKQDAAIRAGSFSNGLLPDWALCSLPGYNGKKLRADAAKPFQQLNVAYAEHFGKTICITDSYRSLAAQQSVYVRKPGMSAVPGTSNHGWGYALDLGCGINDYGSPQFNWMKAHAPEYGWVHPSWAEHSPFEPWHWEYEPGTHTQPAG